MEQLGQDTSFDIMCSMSMSLLTIVCIFICYQNRFHILFAEALEMANQYEAKYTETSAALNHNVDELLVGTLDHIRYKLNPSLPEPILKLDTRKSHAMRVPSFKGPIDFFRRLFSRGNKKSPKLLKL